MDPGVPEFSKMDNWARPPATLGGGGRPIATPARTSAPAESAVNRMRLQTVLRRSREESGNMQVFIQEQYRFLQEVQPQHGTPGGGAPRFPMPVVESAPR